MNLFGSYDIFVYLACAFILHVILHWIYEESESMSSVDYVCAAFFLYFGIFGAYAYYLPECKEVKNEVGLCWTSPAKEVVKP